MIEVFKTTVRKKRDARKVISQLKMMLPSSSINIDLQDCDKVLRIETSQQTFDERIVFELLTQNKFHCEILDW
ncbi:MAG TPA: hypothetical protein VD908_03135 [Cytophagales bacterium]|nr:hypothetical protein [Cytophagales bacterium]